MIQAYSQLIDHVHQIRRLWRVRRLIEGLCLTAAIVLGVLTVAVMADHAGDFGVFGRMVLALLFWLSFVTCAWVTLIRPGTMCHADEYFAVLAEQRQPQLGNRLINALQLGRDPTPAAPRLVEAIVTDGVSAADDLEPYRAVATPTLQRIGVVLVGILIVSSVYLSLGDEAAATSLRRVLMPTADIAPFTWTSVSRVELWHDDDLLTDRAILEGEPLTVVAHVSGRAPERATLHWRDGSGRPRAVGMTSVEHHRGDGLRYEHTFPVVDSDFDLRIHAGDGAHGPVHVHVVPRPRIIDMQVAYHYPAYTAELAHTVHGFDGHLRGVPQTQASLAVRVNKPLASMSFNVAGRQTITMSPRGGADTWHADITLTDTGTYRLAMTDGEGYDVVDPSTYSITITDDRAPVIVFVQPARDVQLRPGGGTDLVVVAEDDFGLGAARMLALINPDQIRDSDPIVVHAWSNDQTAPLRQLTMSVARTAEQLNLSPGDRMQYWATIVDRNDVSPVGPGIGKTRRYNIFVLTPEQADALLQQHMADYEKVLADLLRRQRVNRAGAAEFAPADELLDRQGLVRRMTLQLVELMQSSAFPAYSVVADLRELTNQAMPQVMGLLETYRDTDLRDTAKLFATRSLPIQDDIIKTFERILLRLARTDKVRTRLKKLKEDKPEQHEQVTATIEKLGIDLDDFLSDVRDLKERYERIPKRNVDELSEEQLKDLADIEHRLDRWKKWGKDTVDDLVKLPEGFVKDSYLAENISTIFEEIEKQARGKTTEIATPIEEGIKALATEIAEDLEMWTPHAGDSIKWVMEDPMEGRFEVPETKLPSNLQDIIGDLIEDVVEFDEESDDITGGWGGNMQQGWDIMDGPISSFGAQGKTGNQLPNTSEMSGRSGAGRRGKSSGQMVGAESRGLEGRPTPARLTNERYEQGNIDASKQLDPRGATGGGKKTGAGQRGLQGGTPPDYQKYMERFDQQMKLLRERSQQIAQQLGARGRPTVRVDHALQLLQDAQDDMRNMRYEDAAHKRKIAIGQLRAEQSQIDQTVRLSMQKAPDLSPELREQITAGAQQALPEGYEDMVGAYYKALSAAGAGGPDRSAK